MAIDRVVIGLLCFWIVGIWVLDPLLGELHENVKVKTLWTVISAFVLVAIIDGYTRRRRRDEGHE